MAYTPTTGFSNMSAEWNTDYLKKQKEQADASAAREARVGGQYNAATGTWTGVDPSSFNFDQNSTRSFTQQATLAGVQPENQQAFAEHWVKAQQNRAPV